jgi:hypothetical protein
MDSSERNKAVIEMSKGPQQPQPKKDLPRPVNAAKKPYSTPKLVVYGTLHDITGAVGNKGAKDGGTVRGSARTGG